MKRSNGWLLLLVLLPAAGLAQLKPPPPPTAIRPVQLPSPPPSPPKAEDRSQKAENERVREQLQKPALRTRPASKPTPIVQPTTVRPVYDSNGQPANHLQQTSPNRVLDTRTNRYYDTVPSGTGQRVVPPPTGKK